MGGIFLRNLAPIILHAHEFMLKTSKGLVLSTLRYNDERVIADVFTQSDGRVSFMVNVPRAARRRAAVRLLQPLVPVEVEWVPRAAVSLMRPRALRPGGMLVSVPFEPRKTAIALFLAEFLRHALAQQPADEALFAYLMTSVEWLDACTDGYANFHLVFLLRLSRFLGFYPNLDGAGAGQPYFDMLAARFSRTPPLHGHYLEPADAARLPLLMRMRYDTMARFRFSHAERHRMLDFINQYYRLHLPDFPALKSLDVLRQVFA